MSGVLKVEGTDMGATLDKNNGFCLFLVVWNAYQNQTTPRVHLKIAAWLERAWTMRKTRLLLMAFRSCGKSTLVGLFAAWLLWRQPDLRILVLAADAKLAEKMVRNTRRIIERHPLTRALRPDKADQWASNRFTVKRKAELRDASMAGYGIGANITGSRADVVVCDDVEVPNTADTAEKREFMRERLLELSFVLVPGGTQLYVGTPHAFDTIYQTKDGDYKAFLKGYDDLRVPILDKNNESAWPERFTAHDIEKLRRTGGPRRFGAQMMLEAQPIDEGRLLTQNLRWYDDELVYSEAQGRAVLTLMGRRLSACSAWWDPAFGGKGDGSVVAVLFTDEAGDYWLHHVAYLKNDANDARDEATQQAAQIAQICAQFYVPSITVEINGIGRFLPAILRRELKGRAAVVEVTSTRPKDLRILEGFDAVLAARALYVHSGVRRTGFVDEMQSWKPGGRGRDDGLDAVAGALSQAPVRIGRFMGGGGLGHGGRPYQGWGAQGWGAKGWGVGPRMAKTDFNVMGETEK